MKKYGTTWILVADAARARLLKYAGFGAELVLLDEWTHPESRTQSHNLVTDRPGRVAQSHQGPHPGHGSKSAMEPDVTPKEAEHEVFARLLVAKLAEGVNEIPELHIVLVANPRFLGSLRRLASEQVRKHIVASQDKDYTALTLRELSQQLAPVIYG